MTRKIVVRVILLSLIVFAIVLPAYYFRNFLIMGYKFINPDYSKVKLENGIVSILVLGKGGEGHTAPDLTDTLMNVYVNQNSKKISLLPLPRDIWIPELRAKLNSSYYWGKQKTGSGLESASESVSGITGIKPSYVVVVDFSLFKDLVDTLGGIEVEVVNSFVDPKFPIAGRENDLCSGDEHDSAARKTFACRYETLEFTKGKQLMDGERALKFVRSRNAEGDEGTDLARETRQQKVIEAVKSKVLSTDIMLSPSRLKSLYLVINSHLETNIDLDTAIILARIFYDSRDNVQNISIPEDLLAVSNGNPKHDKQYVFIPKAGTWKELQEWLAKSL